MTLPPLLPERSGERDLVAAALYQIDAAIVVVVTMTSLEVTAARERNESVSTFLKVTAQRVLLQFIRKFTHTLTSFIHAMVVWKQHQDPNGSTVRKA